jgi:hypothetical protein
MRKNWHFIFDTVDTLKQTFLIQQGQKIRLKKITLIQEQ